MPTGQNIRTSESSAGRTPTERLIRFLEEQLSGLGYELVAIEILNHREKKLRVFVDFPQGHTGEKIGIEDCVRVTHSLDQPLDTFASVDEIFKGQYELEVSSPGIDRPLRKPSDYTRFAGEIARLHTFRPLTVEETQATEYSTKNPKQKNFFGVIRGFDGDAETGSVLFGALPEDGTLSTEKGKKVNLAKKAAEVLKKETWIRIPLELISKANLEPAVKLPELESE